MEITEIGVLPFITNSALHLTHLEIRYCDWVTDRSLQAIGSSSSSKTIKKLVLNRCDNISDYGVSCLKNLCLLEELSLTHCSQITDCALKFLSNGSITQIMKKLDISHCRKITDVGVSHMQKMCVLEQLNLKECVITNRALEFLANGSLSKTLKKLNLTGCYCIYGSGVPYLKNMSVLEELNFPEGGHRITDRRLEFLANGSWSKTMKKLHLSSTDITDVVASHLSDMCVLNELNLSRCHLITDRAIEYLANGSVPRTMKKLDISYCNQITDVGVSHMQKMCVLEELNLGGCGTITDRALEFLANGFPSITLRMVDGTVCKQITDAGFSNMQKMCVLEELKLTGCVEITNRALEFLANGFPSKTLQKLDLLGTNITDVGVSHLRDMCVLEELDLTYCSITDGGLKFLANGFPSKTLKKLVLTGTNITDAGIQFLQNMCVLEEPDLEYCSLITDYGLEYLANGSPSKTLKFLNFLEIWGTYIINVGVSHLQKMLVME